LVRNLEDNKEYTEACGCDDVSTAIPRLPNDMIELEGFRVHCPTLCWVDEQVIDLIHIHVIED